MAETRPPDRPTTQLTKQTLSGLQWSYLGSAASAVLQFGMTAVMARLLTPAAFGLVALASLFLRFVQYFAKAGITQALIQKPSLSRGDIRAAFTLSAGLASLFAVLVILAAPTAGRVAQDPDLVPVLRWMVLGLVLAALGSPSTAMLRRQLRFRALTVTDVGSYVIGYLGVGLWMALTGAGVYALVGATLTQTGVRSASAYVLVRHPLLPTRARKPYRAILSFGARVSVVGFLEFLATNLDTLAVGRWAGTTQLGLYNRANLLAILPAQQLTGGLAQVLFPSFSAIQGNRRRLLGAYESAVGLAATIVLPVAAGMAVAATEIVLVVLGPQWVGSIEVLPWLLAASSLALVGQFAGVVAEAQAALNAKMLVAGAATTTLALFLFLAQGRSLAAYGAALAASALVSHLGYVAILTRTLETNFRSLVRPYARAALGAGVVAAAIAVARVSLLRATGVPIAVVLAAEILVGMMALAALLVLGPLRPFRDDLAQRLFDAGLLRDDSGGLTRVVGWLVGGAPPKTPKTPKRTS